jgi:tetratricopeptide (TPR) repeat protein
MSDQSSMRLWGLLSVVIIVIFLFIYIQNSPEQSSNSDYWEDGIEAVDNTPRSIGVGDILLFAATAIAFLATFHPSYGGWNPKYRWYYQGFVVLLICLSALSISWLLNSTSSLLTAVFLFTPVIWIIYSLGIPLLIGAKQYALVHLLLNLGQSLAPRNANLYITRAWLYQLQMENEKAIQAASRAIELTPRFKKKDEGWFSFDDWRLISAHNIRMVIYFGLAQHDLALDDAEILVRIHPTSPVHYVNRSLALRKRGEYEAAEADLDKAGQLKIDSFTQAFLLYSRGHLATLQAQTIQARNFFNAALEVTLTEAQQKNFHPEVYKELGLLEMREGREAEAEEAFRKAQVINRDYPIVGLALLHAQRGEWDLAVDEWKRLITLQPSFGDLDITRRHHKTDPTFVALIEQIFARLGSASESPVLPSHPLMAS